jgi:hypothetical protein
VARIYDRVASPEEAGAITNATRYNLIRPTGSTVERKSLEDWLADVLGATTVADVAVSDTNYTVQASDKYVAVATVLTAPRTFTLPPSVNMAAKSVVVIADTAGGVSSTNPLTIAAQGTDTIAGGASLLLAAPYGAVSIRYDGAGKYTVTNRSNGREVGSQFSIRRKHSATDGDSVWAEPGHARANILEFATNPSQSSGASGNGTDMQPAAIAALTAINSRYGGRGELFIPPGAWRFASGIPGSVLKGNRVIGAGALTSNIFFDNVNDSLFWWTAAGGFTGGGAKGLGIYIITGGTTGTSIAIHMEGDATFQPSQMVFHDLYITSLNGAYWWNGFVANGRAKNTGAQGIRVLTASMVQVFTCRNAGIYLDNVIQGCLLNCGTYVPLVGTGGADVYITGGGNLGPTLFDNSTYISTTNLVCNGTLQILNVNQFPAIDGTSINLLWSSNANHGTTRLGVAGTTSGTPGANVNVYNYT